MLFTLGSFIGFTLAVAAISYYFTRKDKMNTSDDYFLGGRSLTAWVIAGSLMLTNLSTEHLVGLNGDAFRHTIAVMAWETTAAIAMVLTALYFLPKYLKSGFTTIPQFLSERYDSQTRVIAVLIFLFSYVIAVLPVVLIFGAAGIESLFDLSKNLGIEPSQAKLLTIWGIGILGSLYAVFGGLKAVAISDTINGVGFLVAGLSIPALALWQIGQGDMWHGLEVVYQTVPEKFDITGDEPGSFLPLGVLFTGMIVNQIFFWCTNQSIVQRALAAKNLAEGQKGVLIAAAFKLIGPLVIVLPGVIAFYMFRDSLAPEDYLLAYPSLVKAVLPPACIGLFAAVMIGAVLSTFNSVLNSSATLFSEGIYHQLLNRQASGPQLVRSGRIISIILALAAMIMAPFIDTSGSLYSYLQKINATFFGPMLAVILLGFFSKKVSARAAKIGLIGGPLAFYLVAFAFEQEVQSYLKTIFQQQQNFHFLHLLALVFILTVIVMLVVSVLSPATKVYQARDAGVVDIQAWPYAKFAGGLIITLSVSTYIFLAQ